MPAAPSSRYDDAVHVQQHAPVALHVRARGRHQALDVCTADHASLDLRIGRERARFRSAARHGHNHLLHPHARRPLRLRNGAADGLLPPRPGRRRRPPSRPRVGCTPTPNTRVRSGLPPDLGTAAIRHTALLVPMSNRPTISSACLLAPRPAATCTNSNACSDAAGRHFRVRGMSCRLSAAPSLAHQRAAGNAQIDLLASRLAGCGGQRRCPRQRLA